MSSLLVHVTVVPALTVSGVGANAKRRMATSVSAACAAGAGSWPGTCARVRLAITSAARAEIVSRVMGLPPFHPLLRARVARGLVRARGLGCGGEGELVLRASGGRRIHRRAAGERRGFGGG